MEESGQASEVSSSWRCRGDTVGMERESKSELPRVVENQVPGHGWVEKGRTKLLGTQVSDSGNRVDEGGEGILPDIEIFEVLKHGARTTPDTFLSLPMPHLSPPGLPPSVFWANPNSSSIPSV